MKISSSILLLSIMLVACQAPPPADDSALNETLAKNTATLLVLIDGFQNENLDYDALFAEDCVFRGTSFGAPDTMTLDQRKERDAKRWAMFDYKLLNSPPNILPGVNAETKKVDGSVRYYGDWEVTMTATDSTEAKSGVIKGYSSLDFNDEGKVSYFQFYGDSGGLVQHLMSTDTE